MEYVGPAKYRSATSLIFLAIVLAVLYACAQPTWEAAQAREPTDTDACYAVRRYVRNELRAPGTARFRGCSANESEQLGVWIVVGDVDAENAFGGEARERYIAHLRYEDSDEWSLVTFGWAGH